MMEGLFWQMRRELIVDIVYLDLTNTFDAVSSDKT